MFRDYYQILDVPPTATLAEIRQAYRAQSLRWHPDRNQGRDTNSEMRAINEAYSILKDAEKRARYDLEYSRFKQTRQSNRQAPTSSAAPQNAHTNRNSWTYDYNVHDEQVKSDMEAASAYAKSLVDEFLKGLKENSVKAAKGAWEEMQGYILGGLIFSIIVLLILAAS